MSTFNGQVLEFPDIRVDFFRHAPNARPPLACFLSHVHSDHLAGLESLKAPFVYCSAATREILLRLERFPHRVNFQLGILQSRVQHYRHLKNLLKPLPLETPTRIELAPGKEIQVTLFDANHCTGSVMFLVEGDGKAILYTGDIRCEPWFVNGLRRNPILMEYTSGIKKLDCVYLDTTFLDDIHFPTKAEGLAELLKKIRKYPADTTFHFTAWTFGYEEVWIALSKALKSPIHVDQYKLSLYESLCPTGTKLEPRTNPAYLAAEAPALIGHHYANNYQRGCLTLDPTVQIHSCEKGMRCPALTRKTVNIQPILARGTNGVELLELGAGGGQGDLTQKAELEIDSDMFVQRISNFFKNASEDVINDMRVELTKKLQSGRNTVKLEELGLANDADEVSLEDLVKAALSAVPRQNSQNSQMEAIRVADEDLPRMITFPYSRHASYEELCDLVAAFQPEDVYPCTVDERKWFAGVTMKSLFGQCCEEATVFRHDEEMGARYGKPIAGATQTQHPSQDAIACLAEEDAIARSQQESVLVASPPGIIQVNKVSKMPYKIKHIGQAEKEQISAGITRLQGKPAEIVISYLKNDVPNINWEEDPQLDLDQFSSETLSRVYDLIQVHCRQDIDAVPEHDGHLDSENHPMGMSKAAMSTATRQRLNMLDGKSRALSGESQTGEPLVDRMRKPSIVLPGLTPQQREEYNTVHVSAEMSEVFNNPLAEPPVATHKRKADGSLPGTDKRLREISPDLDDWMDLDSQSISIDWGLSDDEWEADDSGSHDLAFWTYKNDEEANNIWDPTDKIWRCRDCGWEKWYRFRDCICVDDLGVTGTEDREMSAAGFRTMHTIDGSGSILDIDLMNSPSNYDSVSDAADDEYEMHSFIEDSPISDEESSDKDSDYEVDDKEKYLKSLAQRATLNTLTRDSRDNCEEHKRMVLGSDYDSEVEGLGYMEAFLNKNDDSDSEAQADDPDYRYLWEKMKRKENDALGRLVAVDIAFEQFRRAMPDYISEEDPWNSAYDPDFDEELDMPRNRPEKSAAENEKLRKMWAKDCEKFLQYFRGLCATKKAFKELREMVFGAGNDKYRDLKPTAHLKLMEGVDEEPAPYGTAPHWSHDVEIDWELASRVAHVRMHAIHDLLQEERKTFRDWRRAHKEDYITYEDPYDSEYPTTIEDDNADAAYLNTFGVSDRDTIDTFWWEEYQPQIPVLASEAVYRKLWSRSCRAFEILVQNLTAAKKRFKKYRGMAMEPSEVDCYIDLSMCEYADKLFSLDHEPRPFGLGKLGRFGNDERGWEWKELAERARARIRKMHRLILEEEEMFERWRIRHALDYESDCDPTYPDPGEDHFAFSDCGSVDDGEKESPLSRELKNAAKSGDDAQREKRAVWLPRETKQTRVTDYFSDEGNFPWHLYVHTKGGLLIWVDRKWAKQKTQTRITDFIPGKEHVLTPHEKIWGRRT